MTSYKELLNLVGLSSDDEDGKVERPKVDWSKQVRWTKKGPKCCGELMRRDRCGGRNSKEERSGGYYEGVYRCTKCGRWFNTTRKS